MTKLDNDKLIDKLNKLQRYDENSMFYETYIDKFEYGDYIKFDDVEDMIKDLISNDKHNTKTN